MKTIQECQQVVTLLGFLSGGVPTPRGRQIEHEEESLRCLAEFFGEMAANEQEASKVYFTDEVMEDARHWMLNIFTDGSATSELSDKTLPLLLCIDVVPEVACGLLEALNAEISPREINQLSSEELKLRLDLCATILEYVWRHTEKYAGKRRAQLIEEALRA